MGPLLVVALLIVIILALFFAFGNSETRERLLLVGGIIVLAALTAYVLTAGAQSSSGELNGAIMGNTNVLMDTASEIAKKIDVGG